MFSKDRIIWNKLIELLIHETCREEMVLYYYTIELKDLKCILY